MEISISEVSVGCLSGKLEVNEFRDARIELAVAATSDEEFKSSLRYLLNRPSLSGTCYLKLPQNLGLLESMMLVGKIASWCSYVALYDHTNGSYVVVRRPEHERAFGGPPLFREPEIGDLIDDSEFVNGPKDPFDRNFQLRIKRRSPGHFSTAGRSF